MLPEGKDLELNIERWQRLPHILVWLIPRNVSSKFHSKTWVKQGTEQPGTGA